MSQATFSQVNLQYIWDFRGKLYELAHIVAAVSPQIDALSF